MAERETNVREEDILNLLTHFATSQYKAVSREQKVEIFEKNCLFLLARDFAITVVQNRDGDLCNTYPFELLIPASRKEDGVTVCDNQTLERVLGDEDRLYELFKTAHLARCRCRFPVPVMLVMGKVVCRSATLSLGIEACGRDVVDSLSTRSWSGSLSSYASLGSSSLGSMNFMQTLRQKDAELLEELQMRHICDLMVEEKKVKLGMYWSSSEKTDREQYKDFHVSPVPYPGCEFFKEVGDHGHGGRDLYFNWLQSFVNAKLDVEDFLLGIDWHAYKTWDLVKLTQNYLRLFLHYLESGSVLVHCISGWDRTPLFISLLRLSLWADGVIHESLDEVEILYFTIAYDWLLFGHQLTTRLDRGEKIFFFCFNFLENIVSEEFSTTKGRLAGNSTVGADACRTDGSAAQRLSDGKVGVKKVSSRSPAEKRAQRLHNVRDLFLEIHCRAEESGSIQPSSTWSLYGFFNRVVSPIRALW